MPGFDLDATEATRFSVSHANRWTSTRFESAGMAGRNAAYIEDPDDGFAYADHAATLRLSSSRSRPVAGFYPDDGKMGTLFTAK